MYNACKFPSSIFERQSLPTALSRKRAKVSMQKSVFSRLRKLSQRKKGHTVDATCHLSFYMINYFFHFYLHFFFNLYYSNIHEHN